MNNVTQLAPTFPRQRIAKPSRKMLLMLGGLATVAVLLAFAIHWALVGRYLVGTDDAYVRADVATISPRVAGYLSEVDVADNQRVRVGQVLARIDDKDYRARVDQAQAVLQAALADLAARQADVANVEAGIDQQRSIVAQDIAEIRAKAATAHLAALEYRRQQALNRQQVTSAQLVEAAGASAESSSAQVVSSRAAAEAAKARLPMLASQVRSAKAGVLKAQAAVAQAKAALALSQIDLGRSVVRAPIAGIVGQRTLRIGQYVEVGAPLLAIVPPRAYVVANYKETQINHVKAGQPASIKIDAFGGATLRGRVDSIAPASGAEFALLPPDNATGNFTKIVQRMPIRITVDPDQPRASELRPGLSVVTTIDTKDDAHGR